MRQQINVLRRTAPKRLSLSVFDRLVFIGLYRLLPNICDAPAVVKPDTIVRWHSADFPKHSPGTNPRRVRRRRNSDSDAFVSRDQ